MLSLQTPRGSTVQVSRVQAERALRTQGVASPAQQPRSPAARADPRSPLNRSAMQATPSRDVRESPSNRMNQTANATTRSPSSRFQGSPMAQRTGNVSRVAEPRGADRSFAARPSSATTSRDPVEQAIQEIKNMKVDAKGLDVWPVAEIKPDFSKVDAIQQALRTKMETLAGFSSDPAIVVRRVFKDASTDGQNLSEAMFVKLITEKFNFQGYGPEIKALFKRFDVDRSGTVDVKEFLDIILSNKGAVCFSTVIGRIREVLAKRSGGTSSLKGLALQFKIADSSGDGNVDRKELEWGFTKFLRAYGMELTDRELDALFKVFDYNNDGTITYDEFVHGIRGQMNEFRSNLVKKAFAVVDNDGSGSLTVDEIARRYDVSGHPLVKAGKITPVEAIKTFMLQWQLHSKDKDDIITLDEFLDYYDWISMNIDRDDYFELMIRNAWHIAGGSGWSENTSNLRVLVTHQDGRQTVETVNDDLGIKQGDLEEIKRRLLKQGIRAAKISIKDASEG